MYLVTGGAGFIGSHIVEALLQQGKRVRVLDNFSTGRRENLPDSAEVLEGDIRDVDAVRRATQGVSVVFHQAAIVSVQQSMSDPLTTHSVNVTGTLNVLLAARESGAKRVVFASSCSVYGNNDNLPLGESAALGPLSPYAASKLVSEIYFQLFSQMNGLTTVCLRYFNVYGPRQNPAGDYAAVIPKFVGRIKAGQSPMIFGEGTQTRDFVHVWDVARANLLAGEHEAASGKVYNVASGQRTSLLELVDVLNDLGGTAYSPVFEHERPGDVRHSQGDANKIRSQLGFRAEITLAQGLAELLR